jgi:hypothetical protein
MGFRKQLIDDFLKLKAEFLTAHHSRKKDLKKGIDKLRADIASFGGHKKEEGFDWAVEFAEIFVAGGFDIAISNPPYVRMELFKAIKPMLKLRFPKIHAERTDLYCYFYARAIESIRPGGMLVFISSNKWFRAGYGANLRSFVADHCSVLSITDFGELPIFDAAATFPMIFVARRDTSPSTPILTQVETLDPPYPDLAAIVREEGCRLSSQAVQGSAWMVTDRSSSDIVARMRTNGIPLADYAGSDMLYGIKTGLNSAFVIDDHQRRQLLSENPQCARAVKRFVVGDDIRKWRVENDGKWLLYMYHSIDTEGLKPIISHLRPYKSQLERRATKQEWYELQQPQLRYSEAFERPKIIFPDIAKERRFAFDTKGRYIANTAYAIARDDLFLLAVLNSTLIWAFVKATFSCLGDPERGGRFRFFSQFVSAIPIPKCPAAEKDAIALLAERCLSNRDRLEHYERDIDARVARLFKVKIHGGSAVVAST